MMTKSSKFIFNAFVKLTSMTCPYGYEDQLVKEMTTRGLFPKEMSRDVHGNYFVLVGESRTIFASHLDTVSKSRTNVKHVFEGDMIKTDGTTTLGADDKAGVAIMLWMIKNEIPGMYYFFMGEEVGCIGSGKAASSVLEFKGRYDRIISFDRRGTGSVITHQSWSRCCSDSFGEALASELNKSGMSYKKDDGGVYTDSAEFVDIIPECTNISVGYYKEHTFDESQDINHLCLLADVCLIGNHFLPKEIQRYMKRSRIRILHMDRESTDIQTEERVKRRKVVEDHMDMTMTGNQSHAILEDTNTLGGTTTRVKTNGQTGKV